MKKIINGKRYDTETADIVASDQANCAVNDFNFCRERLHLKTTGEYFLHGEGGPMTKYAVMASDNSRSGGENIIPLTRAEAMNWCEAHCEVEEYESIFGPVEE
jgi:hypothetical protein